MSSGTIHIPQRRDLFLWSDVVDNRAYVRARYHISSALGAEESAINMAMEQSAATVSIDGYLTPDMLTDWTIRVVSAKPLDGERPLDGAPIYLLDTEVYDGSSQQQTQPYDIELAIPLCLLYGKPAQLLNVLIGELPRLGFISSFRLVEAELPPAFGQGPSWGIDGILKKFGAGGPLLCRSMRPAVGLPAETMERLNRDALTGGFHLVKDDELQVFADDAIFASHVRQMLRARDEAMQASGERKGYIANLICEPWELESRLATAADLGVDGVLVAPLIQGLGILPMLARQAPFPVLAHNSFSDLSVRNPGWGIDDAVLGSWFRRLGADWVVTPGSFAEGKIARAREEAFLDAVARPLDTTRRAMPILQGGKNPQGLANYVASCRGREFMLIVASWIDRHPAGLKEAARLFRMAVDSQSAPAS